MSFCFNYEEKSIEENYFLKKYKKGKYQNFKIEKINFINKCSVQSDSLYFTNKFQRTSGHRIDSIKSAIQDLELHPDNLNEYFEGEDINLRGPKDLKKINRLDKLLRLNNKYPNNSLVFKYAPNNKYYNKYNNGKYERGFQLIFTHENNCVNVYLIDLYHLAILSKGQNLRLEYNQKKDYKHCISYCIFNENNNNKSPLQFAEIVH